jgi:hypothetical protein
VRLRTTDLERIAEAFAQAWAEGDVGAAAGWANAAAYAAGREEDRRDRASSDGTVRPDRHLPLG